MIQETEPYIIARREKKLKKQQESYHFSSFDEALGGFKDRSEDFNKRYRNFDTTRKEKDEIIEDVVSLAMAARKFLEDAKENLPEQIERIEDEAQQEKLRKMLSDIKLFDDYYSFLYERGLTVVTPEMSFSEDNKIQDDVFKHSYSGAEFLENGKTNINEVCERRVIDLEGYQERIQALQLRLEELRELGEVSPLFEVGPSLRERLKGFSLNELDLEKLVGEFPKEMRDGLLGVINDLVKKYSVVAECTCRDGDCYRKAGTRGYFDKLSKQLGISKYNEENNVLRSYFETLVIGDLSDFFEVYYKHRERLREVVEKEKNKRKAENQAKKAEEEARIAKMNEKSEGFGSLLKAAKKINYNDECGGEAVESFRNHLEYIASRALELEAAGYTIRVKQKSPGKVNGNTVVLLERGGTEMEIYGVFNDIYSRGYNPETTIKRIGQTIDSALMVAKMFKVKKK